MTARFAPTLAARSASPRHASRTRTGARLSSSSAFGPGFSRRGSARAGHTPGAAFRSRLGGRRVRGAGPARVRSSDDRSFRFAVARFGHLAARTIVLSFDLRAALRHAALGFALLAYRIGREGEVAMTFAVDHLCTLVPATIIMTTDVRAMWERKVRARLCTGSAV